VTGKWLWKIEVGIVNIPVRYDDNLDCRDGNGKFFLWFCGMRMKLWGQVEWGENSWEWGRIGKYHGDWMRWGQFILAVPLSNCKLYVSMALLTLFIALYKYMVS